MQKKIDKVQNTFKNVQNVSKRSRTFQNAPKVKDQNVANRRNKIQNIPKCSKMFKTSKILKTAEKYVDRSDFDNLRTTSIAST